MGTENELEEKFFGRPSVFMSSRDVYDPPLGQPTLKSPRRAVCGAPTSMMLKMTRGMTGKYDRNVR